MGGGSLTTLSDGGNGARAYGEAVSLCLAFAVDKSSDYWSTICFWNAKSTNSGHTFGRNAIPIVWDYSEVNPFSDSRGNWMSACKNIRKSIECLPTGKSGSIDQHDAQTVRLPKGSVISTDPPYYDNVPYADLSDFFFCWLKKSVGPIYPQLFQLLATPKDEELVANNKRHGGKKGAETFFLKGMKQVFANIANQELADVPLTIYYAFKQKEIKDEGIVSAGWAAFLDAVINSGFIVQRTWPVRTEQTGRLTALGKNALSTSVVLVCRKRPANISVVNRSEFIGELKRELRSAIGELQSSAISPADMPQSAIGPGISVFSRYLAVQEADDSKMTVRTALQLINRELDEYVGDLQGDFDDETRFAVSWFKQFGFEVGEYGVANNIATARGLSVDDAKAAGIIESAGGKVRILAMDELVDSKQTVADNYSTVWRSCHRLIAALKKDGEQGAAKLLLGINLINPSQGDKIKNLAYCLYNVCDNAEKHARLAVWYNNLILVWPDILELAGKLKETSGQSVDPLNFKD